MADEVASNGKEKKKSVPRKIERTARRRPLSATRLAQSQRGENDEPLSPPSIQKKRRLTTHSLPRREKKLVWCAQKHVIVPLKEGGSNSVIFEEMVRFSPTTAERKREGKTC